MNKTELEKMSDEELQDLCDIKELVNVMLVEGINSSDIAAIVGWAKQIRVAERNQRKLNESNNKYKKLQILIDFNNDNIKKLMVEIRKYQ